MSAWNQYDAIMCLKIVCCENWKGLWKIQFSTDLRT